MDRPKRRTYPNEYAALRDIMVALVALVKFLMEFETALWRHRSNDGAQISLAMNAETIKTLDYRYKRAQLGFCIIVKVVQCRLKALGIPIRR